ncbi:phosphate ABC transporter substrate-binding protein PstS family protein [Planctomicrobium sp. SH668]|uniref:phosphate ABC transporter substrate-binding protein PstS family protein n=1 Tax=Planctomicrobium sp. SH668 TaxID=3448126 RepID=UPI003F5CAB9D
MHSTVRLFCLALTVCLLGCNSKGSSGPEYTGPVYLPANAVLPTLETIENGTYKPLSRPLYIYVKKSSLKLPETAAFLRFVYSSDGLRLVGESGFIPLSKADLNEQIRLVEEAIAASGPPTAEKLTGKVILDGSSTVAPIATALAEEFSILNSGVRVPVGTHGTGGGFKKFIANEIDICNASRTIKDSEKEQCVKAGIEYLELKVAIDGLTVVVHPNNKWVDGLTVEDLHKIWNPDSTIKRWSELNADFPDAPIKLFGPDTDSGTFEYFTESICHKAGASRTDYQQSGDDNFLVTGVSRDVNSLGYFGYAYYAENKEKLKPVAIAP